MLSKELLKKIRRIHLRARIMAHDALSGEYISSFKGQGMEFEEVREYFPGDDVRHIDWNVSARMNNVFIKKFREERELTVFLAVDVSASGEFGTHTQLKRETLAEIAAALAYMAIENNDKVGLILFSDDIETYIMPQKGRYHVLRIIRQVLAFKAQGVGSNIKGALQFLGKVANRKAVVFVLSDFIAPGFSQSLNILSRKHDVVAVWVRDKFELSLPQVGIIELQDAETGKIMAIDTSSAEFCNKYIEQVNQAYARLKTIFKHARVDVIDVKTDNTYIDAIISFFKKRNNKHARYC